MPKQTEKTARTASKWRWLKALWADPVWSKVIAGGILTGIGLIGGAGFYYKSHRSTPPSATQQDSIIERRAALLNESTWRGTTSGIEIPGEESPIPPFPITFHFAVRDNQITGDSTFEHHGQVFETDLRGTFFNESIIKLEYTHRKGVYAFGYIIFQLDQIPTTMSGKCVVYGSVTHRISVGRIDIKKVEH